MRLKFNKNRGNRANTESRKKSFEKNLEPRNTEAGLRRRKEQKIMFIKIKKKFSTASKEALE